MKEYKEKQFAIDVAGESGGGSCMAVAASEEQAKSFVLQSFHVGMKIKRCEEMSLSPKSKHLLDNKEHVPFMIDSISDGPDGVIWRS